MQARERYHHGDLRNALVDEAVERARAGGASAVVLTRIAHGLGVSAAAAYRHFPGGYEDLLATVGRQGREELAARVEEAVARVRRTRDPVVLAQRRLRAAGRAYVAYAVEEPGLFQVACRYDTGADAPAAVALLGACLDELVATGQLPARRRGRADLAAWAVVHGLALLLTEGPLRGLPEPERERVVERTLDVLAGGL